MAHRRLTTWLVVVGLVAASWGGCAGEAGDDTADTGLDAGTDAGDNHHGADAGGDAGDSVDADVVDDVDGGDSEDAGDGDAGRDLPDEPGEFGDVCTDDRPCDDDLHCHRDEDADPYGVCTEGCEPVGSQCLGLPAPGTNAKCLLDDGDVDEGQVCGFICILDHDDHIHEYDCPDELSCEGDGGPGEGHRFCVP